MYVDTSTVRSAALSIGFVARRTGCTVPTIRYYEEIGLLPAAARTQAGQRAYGEDTLRRLTFIRRCRDFGFSIEQVRELIGIADHPERPCAELRDIAAARCADVRNKLDELRALEASLSGFIARCNADCVGGTALACTILEDLDPAGSREAAPKASACCGPSTPTAQPSRSAP